MKDLGDKVVAVALFGSMSRGEATEHSDFDFLVVVRGFYDKARRFKIYDPLRKMLKRDVTILDVDESTIFKEDLNVDSFLLNVAWDGIVLYDPTERLTNLFERIRTAVKKAGLIRYKTKDGKYGWKPTRGGLTVIEV